MIASLLLAVTIVAHDPGYYTSLAKHQERWLTDNGIAAKVVTPKEMPQALAKEKIAFLVGFERPTDDEMRTLGSYRARGGKLVVFYSSSPQLAQLMDVRPLGFAKAAYPGQWSRMTFASKFPEGVPASILQTSSVLQRVAPLPGKGRVMATWSDRSGKSTGDAAWVATAGGYWMSHVLLADGDENLKAQLLSALVGSVDSKQWNYAKFAARRAAADQALRTLALNQVPRKGEIHAVWDHSGCGLYPRNWPKTMQILQAAHVTDLFVNVAGAGFAHYPSDVLPRSKTLSDEGDQLAACLVAARGTGIRVHAWILCFSATRATSDRLEVFAKKGWRLKATNGKLTEYLDPSNPAVRSYVLSAIDEIQRKYAVHGIHLDFVRWGDTAVKPANAADSVTRFVADARRRVKRPKWFTAAVYGKYPQCVKTVGQDWEGWVDANLVDYVVPMDYTDSKPKLLELLAVQGRSRKLAQRTIVGLGVTANESRLDARDVIEQINLTRKFGFAGVALFDLDTTLEKQILPYIRMGIW